MVTIAERNPEGQIATISAFFAAGKWLSWFGTVLIGMLIAPRM